MHRISLSCVVWLLLGPLLAVEASPQFSTTLVTKTWEFLSGCTSTPTVVNCMAETSDNLLTWQNPDFPNNESLPGICTLKLNPAEGTCAYRLNFDNLDLSSKTWSYSSLFSPFSCPTNSPYIKVSTVNYTAPARCQNLTGYEGIVQLPEESTEPVVLLLQTDPNFNISFRVNISAVPCTDIKSFISPNVCGIKNQLLSGSSRNTLRSGALPEDSKLLGIEPKSSVKSLKSVEVQDATLGDPEAVRVDIIETIEDARRSRQLSDQHSVEPDTDDSQVLNHDSTNNSPAFRRLTDEQTKKKKKNKEKVKVKAQTKPKKDVEIGEDAKEFAEKLKKAGNILSYGLGVGIERGNFKYQPNMDTRVVGSPIIPNEWPWMVYIEYLVTLPIELPFGGGTEFKTACNGVLLDESHVITQASCLPGVSVFKGSLDSVRVILGDHDIVNQTDTQSLNVTVSKVTFPMTFSSINVKDDIAVLTLSESVNFSDTVRPVCLPVSYNKFSDDTGILTGWPGVGLNDPSFITSPGIPQPSFGTPELNAVDVKVLDKSACNETINLIAEGLTFLTGTSSLDADDYVCLSDKVTDFPVCDVGLGTPLVRADITNAHYLYGISSIFQVCFSNIQNVFTAIKPDDQFLNLALT